jgi:hypothetical protein
MEDQTFPNILAVTDYLSMNGWKIKKSAAYLHAGQGKLRPQSDGSYAVKAVLKYAKMFLKRRDGQAISGRMESVQQERLQSEARKIRFQADLFEMKSKLFAGSYVEKGSFEHALAQRAILFRSDVETFCRGAVADIIAMVGGDPGKAPDLIAFMIEQSNDWLKRYDVDGGIRPMVAFPEVKDDAEDAADEGEDDDHFNENEGPDPD